MLLQPQNFWISNVISIPSRFIHSVSTRKKLSSHFSIRHDVVVKKHPLLKPLHSVNMRKMTIEHKEFKCSVSPPSRLSHFAIQIFTRTHTEREWHSCWIYYVYMFSTSLKCYCPYFYRHFTLTYHNKYLVCVSECAAAEACVFLLLVTSFLLNFKKNNIKAVKSTIEWVCTGASAKIDFFMESSKNLLYHCYMDVL